MCKCGHNQLRISTLQGSQETNAMPEFNGNKSTQQDGALGIDQLRLALAFQIHLQNNGFVGIFLSNFHPCLECYQHLLQQESTYLTTQTATYYYLEPLQKMQQCPHSNPLS